ncbi:MAG: hypothetical protein C0494_05920 [Sphingobium sp.]|nr:hypothetical protein [Sphingobium sp.]
MFVTVMWPGENRCSFKNNAVSSPYRRDWAARRDCGSQAVSSLWQGAAALPCRPFLKVPVFKAMEDDPSGKRKQRLEICLALISVRRLVGRYIGFDLSADPVWDMLLDLYASEERGRDIAISSLASAANVPPTTALRAIGGMRALGLVYRQSDPADGRRVYIRLTPKAHEALGAIFDTIANGI